VSQQGSCNNLFGNAEVPGSAFPKIYTLRVQASPEVPLARALVVPRVLVPGASPEDPPVAPAEPLGDFFPSDAMTDSTGLARFCFVARKSSSPQNIILRFALPLMKNADETPVHLDIAAAITSNQSNFAEINYSIPGESGQGQVGGRILT
jgi:hypothetical protein